MINVAVVVGNSIYPTLPNLSVFFSREPQKYAREHFHKSVREYFACAREYKNENVPVNLRSAREPSKKCP